MQVSHTLQLTTARCDLRPLSVGDAVELHELWTTSGVRRFLWDDEIIPPSRTAEAIATSDALFQVHRFGLWSVRRKVAPALVGFAGIWPFRDPPEFELLYGVAEPAWGQGLAAEASVAVVEYCFSTLGHTAIRASTDAANVASVRVLDKLGFARVRRDTVGGLDTIFFERIR